MLEAYLRHHILSRKSQFAEIVTSRSFRLIPDDLQYYTSRLEHKFELVSVG